MKLFKIFNIADNNTHCVNNLTVKKVETEQELEQVFNIRKRVFIEEQKVPEKIEMDEFDKTSEHFIAFLGKKPIGCARVRTNTFVKLERIAILKEYRRKGYGKKLTEFLINYCKKNKSNEILIHSQKYITDFYKKFGFKTIGKPFDEAGIDHIKMVLKLV